MEQEVKQANKMPQEEEIDLVEVVHKLWKNRKLILKITVVVMVQGVVAVTYPHLTLPTKRLVGTLGR